ncbi:MAG: hypothetical protein NC300_12030 [Bacteroidales bacterium]|nr:hypothetical protein [Bacteroidales bacterium]
MQIITGKTGENHVTSDDDRALHAGTFGKNSYVLDTGTRLAVTIVSSNTLRMGAGDLVHQGTHARIRDYEDVTIDNGTTGYRRKDLIVARYEKSAGLEKMELKVIKGIPAVSGPVMPGYTEGNILDGAEESEMPLYTVELNGVNIESITPLYTVSFSMESFNQKVDGNVREMRETRLAAQAAQQTADNAMAVLNNHGNELYEIRGEVRERQEAQEMLVQSYQTLNEKVKSNGSITKAALDEVGTMLIKLAKKAGDTTFEETIRAEVSTMKANADSLYN